MSVVLAVSVAWAQGADSGFPPYELIARNVAATDMTVAVEIDRVHKARVIRTDGGAEGYVMWRVSASVFKCYKASLKPGIEISYYTLTESGLDPPAPGTRAIVSLNRKGEEWVLPDAGYSFAYSVKRDALYESTTSHEQCL